MHQPSHAEVYATAHLPAFEYSQVADRLYAGRNPLTAVDIERLQAEGITHLLDLREPHEWAPPRFGLEALDAIATAGLVRYHLPVIDMGAPLPRDLDRASAYIREVLHTPGHRLYVHCRAGRERTAAVLIAWLATGQSITYDQALADLRQFRPQLAPLRAQERAVRDWLRHSA